jgi:hypothetical protein
MFKTGLIIYLEYAKDLHLFLFFCTAWFLLVKDTRKISRKISYNRNPVNNRIDKEGQQLFNVDDDDGVGFVAERGIDDERDVGTDTDVADDEVHVPILLDEINRMNLNQLKMN